MKKPYYYSSTVEDGKVISHEGEPAHAVYLGDIEQIQARSSLYHAWVAKTYPKAYAGWGVMKEEYYNKTATEREDFMNGKRIV